MSFGEDIARQGGLYGVTPWAAGQDISARVFDTLLDSIDP